MSEVKTRPNTTVEIEFYPAELTHEEACPDWDGVSELTADEIAEAIKDGGGLWHVLRDWNLLHGATITVRTVEPNPHYGGDDVLFGEAPKPATVTVTTAEVPQ